MSLPVRPGLVLRRDYLRPYGLTQVQLAERIGVSFPRVNEIINGKRGVTVDTALRLARLFGTTPQFWLNLQRDYDLAVAVETSMEAIHKIEPLPGTDAARVRWWPASIENR